MTKSGTTRHPETLTTMNHNLNMAIVHAQQHATKSWIAIFLSQERFLQALTYLVDLGADGGKHVVQLLVPVPVCQLRVPRNRQAGVETPFDEPGIGSGWRWYAKDHPHGGVSQHRGRARGG